MPAPNETWNTKQKRGTCRANSIEKIGRLIAPPPWSMAADLVRRRGGSLCDLCSGCLGEPLPADAIVAVWLAQRLWHRTPRFVGGDQAARIELDADRVAA